MLKWYDKKGSESDVVLSSRVRLARNFSDYNFADKLSDEDGQNMVHSVTGKFAQDHAGEYRPIFMSNCSEARRNALKDRRIISSYMVKSAGSAVILSPDDSVAVQLNGEDHVRIQALAGGMNLMSCYKLANDIDDYLDFNFDYAYDEKYGYKTSYPTNVGTGLRAGYTLHLPGLVRSKRISKISAELGRFGIKLKRLYGDEDGGHGCVFQISNQKSLGQTEKEIIKDLNDIAGQIINKEREQRRSLYEKDRYRSEDTAYKSYGMLKYARKLSLRDAMNFLSEVMLGFSMGILVPEGEQSVTFNRMIMEIQPSVLTDAAGKALSVDETDIMRAEYVRNNLLEISD